MQKKHGQLASSCVKKNIKKNLPSSVSPSVTFLYAQSQAALIPSAAYLLIDRTIILTCSVIFGDEYI